MTFLALLCLEITACPCIVADDTSYSSHSSDENDGLTITYCSSSESQSQSFSSEDAEENDQCVSAYILRNSGNITFGGVESGNYSKTCLKRPLKKKIKIVFQD